MFCLTYTLAHLLCRLDALVSLAHALVLTPGAATFSSLLPTVAAFPSPTRLKLLRISIRPSISCSTRLRLGIPPCLSCHSCIMRSFHSSFCPMKRYHARTAFRRLLRSDAAALSPAIQLPRQTFLETCGLSSVLSPRSGHFHAPWPKKTLLVLRFPIPHSPVR